MIGDLCPLHNRSQDGSAPGPGSPHCFRPISLKRDETSAGEDFVVLLVQQIPSRRDMLDNWRMRIGNRAIQGLRARRKRQKGYRPHKFHL